MLSLTLIRSVVSKPVGVAKWIAHSLHMREVRGSSPGMARGYSQDPLLASDIKHMGMVHPPWV